MLTDLRKNLKLKELEIIISINSIEIIFETS